MTQQQKIEWIEKMFDLLKQMLPDNNMGMDVHGIDMTKLPTNWKVIGGKDYKTAKRNKEAFDITLFD